MNQCPICSAPRIDSLAGVTRFECLTETSRAGVSQSAQCRERLAEGYFVRVGELKRDLAAINQCRPTHNPI